MGSPIRKKNVTSWVAGAAIAANVCVVSNAAGTVITGAGANDAHCVGISLAAAAAQYDHVDVAGIGDIVWCKAGAAVTYGEALIIGDSSGRVIDCPYAATTTYNIVGFALGSCSNADEQIPVLINPHKHYNHA